MKHYKPVMVSVSSACRVFVVVLHNPLFNCEMRLSRVTPSNRCGLFISILHCHRRPPPVQDITSRSNKERCSGPLNVDLRAEDKKKNEPYSV
jgi:hypothetical protein